MAQYGKPDYWEERYTRDPEPFDWYQRWPGLKDVLQDRLAHAGVKVIAFNMTDLSYAPEIAQAMLVRQQAEAMVKARRLIVKGAVDISEDAIQQLDDKGVKMSESEKTKIVTNLLTVICGESGAQPTVQLH